LDSALSLEVISYIKEIGRKNRLIVIASIHQPSTTTFHQFDKLCLLSQGKTCYFGDLHVAPQYFASLGYPVPPETNSAEHYLDLINIDLDKNGEVLKRTVEIASQWATSTPNASLSSSLQKVLESPGAEDLSRLKVDKLPPILVPVVLLHRLWIKSHRDLVVYAIRVAMYLGLALLMGTVFLRLNSSQSNIQPFINAIFFGGAFMSFMAVAYVPAFLEDLHTFHKERANGLVGPFAFVLSNFLVGLPFLFLIVIVFSVVEYWLSNFRADGGAFFMWVLWLFLDLVAAESLVVLVASLFPVFVVALAVTAFANGLWMCVDGFLVPMSILNSFWKYVFHYIDYQAYVFQGMFVNEFEKRTYDCQKISDGTNGSGQYYCMYPSDLNSEGKIRGTDVLKSFDYSTGQQGTWIGITIGIILGYRVLAYLALKLRK
jgi:ABC-type multidrug transport system permease subunit